MLLVSFEDGEVYVCRLTTGQPFAVPNYLYIVVFVSIDHARRRVDVGQSCITLPPPCRSTAIEHFPLLILQLLIWPTYRLISRLNSSAGKALATPLERRVETYRRSIIYLRNVFIEYYAVQVGNLVRGYAINERRGERDMAWRGAGRRSEGGGVPGGLGKEGTDGTIDNDAVGREGGGQAKRERTRDRGVEWGERELSLEGKPARVVEKSVVGGCGRGRKRDRETWRTVVRRE
ncbi:hypothetical protein KM043_004072 [Ampulex compressa]|nr:hypothetical protein KM043_004072 [Ampulex compressa]